MQIPPLGKFRQDPESRYGIVWQADPEGASYTLMVPDGEPAWSEGGWDARPDEASYQLALAVAPDADALQKEALAFLERIVAFDRLKMDGEPFIIGIVCDAKRQRAIVELEWTHDVYCRFSVTFSLRVNHPQLPDNRSAVGMAFWAR